MFISLNSCVSYPPNIYILFPLKILVPKPPPKKNKGSDSNSKTPRQIIHQMDALLSQASATVWSLGGVVLKDAPPIWWNISSPQKTGGIDDFFGHPKLVVIFFLLREMGDSGLFQGNLGCSRWWYHAEGVFFFFEWFTWKGHRSQEIRWTWTPWSYFKGSIRWTWGMFIFFCVANLSRIILFRTNMNDDSRSLRYCNTALDFHSRPLQVCFAVCLNVVIRNSKNHFDISLLNLWIAHSEQSQNWRHYIWDLIPVHLRHHRS